MCMTFFVTDKLYESECCYVIFSYLLSVPRHVYKLLKGYGASPEADLNILKWAKRNIKKPIVAIGGINNLNYKKFIKCGAKYIAISSYIWDNPKLKPEIAIRKFK